MFIGWGHTRSQTEEELIAGNFTLIRPDNLQAARVTVAPLELCERKYHEYKLCAKDKCINNPFLKQYEICVKGGYQDVCKGDTGGPLICEGKYYWNTFMF